jgi:hypothetical protein
LKIAEVGDKPHQTLRLMDVEIVGHEVPARCLRITRHRLLKMRDEVCFGARLRDCRSDHLALRDIPVGNQGLCAVPLVLEFATLNSSGPHLERWMFALERLNAGHFIDRERPFADLEQLCRLGVETGHISDLGLRLRVGFAVEPVTALMRLQLDLILKIARCVEPRYS